MKHQQEKLKHAQRNKRIASRRERRLRRSQKGFYFGVLILIIIALLVFYWEIKYLNV